MNKPCFTVSLRDTADLAIIIMTTVILSISDQHHGTGGKEHDRITINTPVPHGRFRVVTALLLAIDQFL